MTMKTFIKYILYIVVLFIISVLVACGGTGSEVGFRPLICGTLFDSCGNPARNAKVVIRSNDYLAPVDTNHLGKRKDAYANAVCSTYTDSRGVYEFQRDEVTVEGVYCIEAWAEDKNSCIFIDNIDIQVVNSRLWYDIDTPYIHTDKTLRPPTSLTGTVYPLHDSTKTFVRVFGLDVCVQVGADGAFRLDDLPQGNYQLQVVSLGEEPSYDTVRAEAGQETTTIPDTIVQSAYRVIYHGNGNTSGTVPVDEKWYDDGEQLTVLKNSGCLERSGYVFVGWNTREDGNGTMYHAGDTFVKRENRVFLYAQWAENRYTITVIDNDNGSVTGTDSVAHGIPHTITAVPDAGYNFSEWRVKSGTAIIADSTAAATTVTLKEGDAVVEGVFKSVRTFRKLFDGSLNQGSGCVQLTNDGGYVMVGSIGGFPETNESDVYLIKTKADGDTLWTRKYGGAGSDEGYSVQQADDGGYVIVGYTTSFGKGGSDVYLIRTDSSGDTLWTNTFGGTGEDIGNSVVVMDDGGFVFGGYSTSYSDATEEAYIVKADANGQFLWDETSNSPVWVKGYSVIRCDDGNFAFVGSGGDSTESVNIFLGKGDHYGDTLWLNFYYGADFDLGYDVKQTADGGFVIVGCTEVQSQGGFPDSSNEVYLIKTDDDGDTLWTKRYDDYYYSDGFSVVQTTDGGYCISGRFMESVSMQYHGFLMKTTPTGEQVWNREFRRVDNDFIGAIYSIQQTTDGGFIIGAEKMCLIKTDANGRVVGE